MQFLGPTGHKRLNEALAFVYLIAGFFVFLSLVSYHPFDPSWNTAGGASQQPVNITGSVGALEATLQTEHSIENLAELDQAWEKLAKIEAHKQWSKNLEPYVVSGTSRWEIYRLLP